MAETRTYEVPGEQTSIGYGNGAYPVKQHRVELPAAAWVTELEAQGVIRRMPDVGPSPEVDAPVDAPAEPEIEIPELFVQAGYATAEAIRSASDAELLAISGVGKATLAQIREALG